MRDKTYDTAIVGGGLSGLIAAFELARAGESVILYEAESELGGFAKSQGHDLEFNEQSWQSFGDFYTNLRDVTDHLGLEWPRASLTMTSFPRIPLHPTRMQKDVKIIFRLVEAMVAVTLWPFHKESWHLLNLQDRVSQWGMKTLHPLYKLGADFTRMPYATVARVVEMSFPTQYTFRVPSLPIRDYLIHPLQRRLKDMGVTIVLNTRVKSLAPKDLQAQTVVAAIPPHVYLTMDTSNLYKFAVTKLKKLHEEARHQQISFRIFFKHHLHYPSRCTFELHKSHWGLVVMPADIFYTGKYWSASVWSGTVTYMDNKDRHGRTPTECTAEQFQESVIAQLLECAALHAWFADAGSNSRKALTNIVHFNTWKTWREDPHLNYTLQSTEVITINSYKESLSRPLAGSLVGPKVFLAGAHAGTGCGVNSMEAAAEAGKRAAIAVLQSKRKHSDVVMLDKHERVPFLCMCVVAMTIACTTLALLMCVLVIL